jgi:hypothetical protein
MNPFIDVDEIHRYPSRYTSTLGAVGAVNIVSPQKFKIQPR